MHKELKDALNNRRSRFIYSTFRQISREARVLEVRISNNARVNKIAVGHIESVGSHGKWRCRITFLEYWMIRNCTCFKQSENVHIDGKLRTIPFIVMLRAHHQFKGGLTHRNAYRNTTKRADDRAEHPQKRQRKEIGTRI